MGKHRGKPGRQRPGITRRTKDMKTPGSPPLSPADAARYDAVGTGDKAKDPGVFLERLQSPTTHDIAAIGDLWHKSGLTGPGHDAGRDLATCLNSGRGSVILARTAKDATIIGTRSPSQTRQCMIFIASSVMKLSKPSHEPTRKYLKSAPILWLCEKG